MVKFSVYLNGHVFMMSMYLVVEAGNIIEEFPHLGSSNFDQIATKYCCCPQKHVFSFGVI